MANCDFYAAENDVAEIVDFLLQNRFSLYESESRIGHEPRLFASAEEVMAAYRDQMQLPAKTAMLQAWHPENKGKVVLERTDLDPALFKGSNQFKYSVGGWGMIQLYFGGIQSGGLECSHTSHGSQKRAISWTDTYPEFGSPSDWDWKAVERHSRAIAYHVRNRLAVARVGSAVVLPHAAQLTADGVPLQTSGGPGNPPMVMIETRSKRQTSGSRHEPV